MHTLTKKQARKLVLVSQRIHREQDFGLGTAGLVKAIEHLGYIQIDTISVVERAHQHTCWNRVKKYRPELLDTVMAERKVFEYWSHAAAYLPMRDYRFSLPRKREFLEGDQHWFKKDRKQMQFVLDRIAAEGPLQAKDFDQRRSNDSHAWGGHKPAKMALELLFMQGDLMVSKRSGFQKVFDLTERVLPSEIKQSHPSQQEFIDYLIFGFLTANGLGTAGEITYLRKGLKPLIQKRCQELLEERLLIELAYAKNTHLALPNFEATLQTKLSLRKAKILSPFDNLLIQRQRMRNLFDFDYQIECYVPVNKRKHGYFVLPILLGQNFIGRMDAKIDRKTKVLTVSVLYIEAKEATSAESINSLKQALQEFLTFNGGRSLVVEKVISAYRADMASLASKLSIIA